MESLLLAALLASSTAASVASASPEDREVQVAGREVHFRQSGRGDLLVVFESGLGEDVATWDEVQPAVSVFARTLAYDRAGLGQSSPSSRAPRDARQLASELHDLLVALGEAGPLLLVGHSLGGAVVQVYAHQYPTGIVGLVLVDPEDGRIDERLATRLPTDFWAAREAAIAQAMPSLPPPIRLEKEALALSGEQAARAHPLPPVPITILSGTKKNPEFPGNPEEQDVKLELHRQLAEQVAAEHILVPESRHYIQNDAPRVVVDAIGRIVERHSPTPPN